MMVRVRLLCPVLTSCNTCSALAVLCASGSPRLSPTCPCWPWLPSHGAAHRHPSSSTGPFPYACTPGSPCAALSPETPVVAVIFSLFLCCFFTTGSGESLNLPELMEGLILHFRDRSAKKEWGTASLRQSWSCGGWRQWKDAEGRIWKHRAWPSTRSSQARTLISI